MATDKPKIQGYIAQSLFDQFEAERQQWGLKQSQALERILSERYGQEYNQSSQQSFDQYESIQKQISNLTSKFVSLEHRVPFDLIEQLESLSKAVYGSSPEITEQSNGDTPEIASSSLDITEQITSDTPSIADVSPEITSDIPSTTSSSPSITSDTPSIAEQSNSDTKEQMLVVCKVNRDEPHHPLYWMGKGFTSDLNKAKTYQASSVGKIKARIEKSDHAPSAGEFISWKTLAKLKTETAAAIAN